ncbi:uncharacterized protein DFL_003253 [Arthrobotrys flagrans]|uniref:Uncharacterized protein n=1 Tax=Arthrobotrys flagrans TaxID=97331 RepID=A0A437A0Y3_ARTFL|nr:hypothetical protein DFL_003253 [Arthrobotrys flagrans]
MSAFLLLLLAFLLSIIYTFNFFHSRPNPQKTCRASYVDAACQTTDLDLESEHEPDLAYTPTTPSTNENLEDLDVKIEQLASPIPPSFPSKIPLYNPQTKLTYLIPENNLPYHPEGLEIPVSVLNRLCKCALESFEVEVEEDGLDKGKRLSKPPKMAFYVLGDGSCEVRGDGEGEVPEGWVKVPESVVEFLADEVVRWVDGEERFKRD